jgi:hypothetical protein
VARFAFHPPLSGSDIARRQQQGELRYRELAEPPSTLFRKPEVRLQAGDATIEPGERVWVGVDVGGERSASAVVIVSEDLRVNAFI